MSKHDKAEGVPDEFIKATQEVGASDEAAFANFGPTPASPINLPDSARLANLLGGAAIAQDGGKGMSTAKIIKHYDKGRFAAINEAMNHQESFLTTASNYAHEGSIITMPPDVLANPNRLYYFYNERTRMRLPIREQADKILRALFGGESDRVFEVCARTGFHTCPLVFVSQMLYHHIVNSLPHDFEKYQKDHPEAEFDPDVDENPESPFIEALRKILEAKTIRDLSKEARYRKLSILTIMRCIMADVATSKGVPVKAEVKA